MGTNTIPEATQGNIIPASDHNSIRTSMIGDWVPRNSSAVATDQAGDLGTNSLRWSTIYGKNLNVDTALTVPDNSISLPKLTASSFVTSSEIDQSGLTGQNLIATISITTDGRPVFVGLLPTGDTSGISGNAVGGFSFLGVGPQIQKTSGTVDPSLVVTRDDTDNILGAQNVEVSKGFSMSVIENLSQGTYTYKLYTVGSDTHAISGFRLVAFEVL